MAKLAHLKISHFRGIESFEQKFGDGITCIIGRGDSGKSTILDAIAYVFSQSWSVHLNDSDFYKCDTSTPIIIEGTVVDIPSDLLDKFGEHIRGIREDGVIIDNMEAEDATNAESTLTIQLMVTKDLEPSWLVVSNHGVEPTVIRATDRGKLNVFAVSDYTDRHFSMNKGNPLYSLYKQLNGEAVIDEENKVLDVIRDAKTAFDNSIGEKFDAVIDKIKTVASTLGITLDEMKAMLDHRDIAISENKVSIHEKGIPFRLKGKGSKRLLSLAIQLALTQPSGVILIDEIEQGLEPDRVQHLVNVLSGFSDKQVIITTHSRNVIVELPCDSLVIMRCGATSLLRVSGDIQQRTIRSNPDVFFARKVIVCEGATEIGIMRAINKFRILQNKQSASCLGVAFADGTGNAMKYYVEGLNSLGYKTALFCDSDPEGKEINDLKPVFRKNGISIMDCEDGYSIEGQVFKDMPWSIVKELIAIHMNNRIKEEKDESIEQSSKSILSSVKSKLNSQIVWSENWMDSESPELRNAISKTAGEKKWFKSVGYGIQLGDCLLSHYSELSEDCHLKKELDSLINWIDE